MKPVTLRRWEIVAAFLLLLVVAVGVAAYNDHRISEAKKQIEHNSQVNEQQNHLRHELLLTLRAADHKACERIEVLKRQNRIDARNQFARLDMTLHLLHLQRTPEIVAAAKQQLRHTLARNAPSKC